ncbi:hypothetical protein [Photorhabdus bodei]|uniref:Uncharacterized protein n=1 Tax=Photorhabdus bodei TaxID=2029681 RepID=A0ABX0AR33_9GAMM|nr:hypothetical protein [Photorhabdus bodei]NDK99548.1 hypothetical protein [Photorhabdus bodei]NDL03876.1 hypothetical protein [Photorhabdus bodei]NDL07927.1 hypothetical protein [Photorhabdus bodei]
MRNILKIINIYTLWISRCIAAARERIPGSIDNYVTGVSECSQQRGNLKDDGYRVIIIDILPIIPRDFHIFGGKGVGFN